MENAFSVVRQSKIWPGLSGFLMAASITAIAVFGLNLGIDFTGGSLIEIQFAEETGVQEVRTAVNSLGFDAVVQEGGDRTYLVRTGDISREEHDTIVAGLNENVGAGEELRFESIGPVIGEELKRKSISAIVLLLALIVFYVAWAFRKVSKPVASWKYGLLTIAAAVHDVLIPLGVFAILGRFFGYQIDTAFIAAILTIMGYSINDTIVVFDRTRENLVSNRHSEDSFPEVVDKSVRQSLARSINTSLTTLLVLLAIFFFGGETTKPFILALIVGIVAGAYSSIFLASLLLVAWEKKKE